MNNKKKFKSKFDESDDNEDSESDEDEFKLPRKTTASKKEQKNAITKENACTQRARKSVI